MASCIPRFAVLSSAFVVIALGASEARADHVEPHLATWSGPVLAAGSPLRVEEETVRFACARSAGGVSCEVRASSVIANPGAEPYTGTIVLYGGRAAGVALRVGGRAAALASVDAAPFDQALGRVTELDRDFKRFAVAVDVAPGARVEIAATLTLTLAQNPNYDLPLTFPSLLARHPVLARKDTNETTYPFEYIASPAASWAPDHKLVARVARPSSWKMDASFEHLGEDRSPAGTEGPASDVGEGVEQTFSRSGPAKKGVTGAMLGGTLEIAAPLPMNGGPFVALGGTLGSGLDLEGFRGRIGYEIAAPRWLFESISVDADFRRRVVVTPALEAMTSQLFVLPAIGVGAGVPIHVRDGQVNVGVRLQASLQIFFVGFTVSVDMYPGLSQEGGPFQTSLMGRVSL